MALWTRHAKLNCWWDGNGAEEVDSPRGSSVKGVRTLEACQHACIVLPVCQGVLFTADRKCYRKTAIVIERCHADAHIDLHLLGSRVPPSPPPPPSPPAPPPWPDGRPPRASFASELRFLPSAELAGQQLPRVSAARHVGLGTWNSKLPASLKPRESPLSRAPVAPARTQVSTIHAPNPAAN